MTRDEAIELLKKVVLLDNVMDEELRTAFELLERKRGEWVYLYEDNYKCSICGSWWCCTDSQIDEMNYCPNCGADMRDSND